jgi:hypothetical protein
MLPDTRTPVIATATTIVIQSLYLLFLDRTTKTCLSIFVIHAVGTYISPSSIGRTMMFTMTFAAASAICYALTSRRLRTVLPKENRLLPAIFLLSSSWYSLRAILVLLGFQHEQDFMTPLWVNGASLLAQVGFSTAPIVPLFVLHGQRVEHDLQQARAEINTSHGIIPIRG